MLVGVVIACTALIPIFGAFIGCVVGAFLILVVNPMQAVASIPDPGSESNAGSGFCGGISDTPAGRRKSDLSSCGGELCGTPFYLGPGCGNCRRKPYGSRGYAGVYPTYLCTLRAAPPDCS